MGLTQLFSGTKMETSGGTSALLDGGAVDILSKIGSRSSIGKGECRKSSEKRGVSRQGGHVVDTEGPRSGLNCQRPAEIDSELATLIASWKKLPGPIRAGIVAMVRTIAGR